MISLFRKWQNKWLTLQCSTRDLEYLWRVDKLSKEINHFADWIMTVQEPLPETNNLPEPSQSVEIAEEIAVASELHEKNDEPAMPNPKVPNPEDFVPAQESTHVAEGGTEEDPSGATRRSGRPVGISKIDLRTVWGSKTPMPGAETSGIYTISYLSIHLSIYLSIYPSIYLSICPSALFLYFLPIQLISLTYLRPLTICSDSCVNLICLMLCKIRHDWYTRSVRCNANMHL